MPAFEGDTYIAATVTEIINRVNPDIIIETGTHLGNTTRFFTSFNKPVLGLEKNEEFLKLTLKTLEGCNNVQVLLGDSPTLLTENFEILKDKKIFGFLDAHWGGGFILERELDFLATINVKPYLAIHDFYNPNHPKYGYDHHDGHPYNFEFYEPYFKRLYGDKYKYYYNDEANGAQQGIIYLEPKER